MKESNVVCNRGKARRSSTSRTSTSNLGRAPTLEHILLDSLGKRQTVFFRIHSQKEHQGIMSNYGETRYHRFAQGRELNIFDVADPQRLVL